MAHMHKPLWTISFPKETYIYTREILDELDIEYPTLISRIKRNNFPAPFRSGHNGKEAQYLRQEVEEWLMDHGFRVDYPDITAE